MQVLPIPDTVAQNALTLSPYNAAAYGFLVLVLIIAIVILWRQNVKILAEAKDENDKTKEGIEANYKEMYRMLFEVSTDANKVIADFESTLKAIDQRQQIQTDALYKRIEEAKRDILDRLERIKLP